MLKGETAEAGIFLIGVSMFAGTNNHKEQE